MGRLKGSCLSSVVFDKASDGQDNRWDMAIDVLCKGSPNLKKLSFTEPDINSFTDAAVQSIVKYCPHMEVLSCYDWDGITDESITYLAQLPALRELDLSRCFQLTSGAVQGLLEVNQKLEALCLSDFDRMGDEDEGPLSLIDDFLLRCIGINCPNLVKLHLCLDTYAVDADVTPESFEALIEGLPALEELIISGYKECNTILSTLGMYCPRLKRIEINIECNDEDFVGMCEGCPLIESVDLSFTRQLTDISILALATNCPLLKQLSISNVGDITDDSLCVLFSTCTLLTSVTLLNSPHITDSSMLALLKCCPQLTILSLSGCPRLTNRSIQTIPTHCPRIQSLTLWPIANVTNKTILQISVDCKHIHTLIVRNCHKLNNNTVIKVLKNCKHLTEVTMCSDALHINDEFKAQCNAIIAKRCYRTLDLYYSDRIISSNW